MAITDSILSDDITRLTAPKQKKGDEYALASAGTMTDATSAAPPSLPDVLSAQEKAFQAKERADQLRYEESQEKKAAAAAKEKALGKRYGEIRAQYEPELQKPAPEFTPSKENLANLGSLGGMLMVLGAMGGSKGLVGATGAMNAMAGMLKGYQDGRKELFDREKATFEQNFKIWQANRTLIKETFDRAMKFAPYDIQKATDKAVSELNAAGATTLGSVVKQSGIAVGKRTFDEASQKFDQQAQPIIAGLRSMQMAPQVTQRAEISGEPTQVAGSAQLNIPMQQPKPTAAKPMTRQQEIRQLDAEARRAEFLVEQAKTAKSLAPPKETVDYNLKDFLVVTPDGKQSKRSMTNKEAYDLQKSGQAQVFQYREQKRFNIAYKDAEGNPIKKSVTAEEADQLASEGVHFMVVPAKSGVADTRYAFNMSESFAQAAQDIINITKLPDETRLPLFAGMTGKSGEGVIDSLRNTFARQITPENERQFQIIVGAFEQNMARALGGGYASSGAKHIIDGYKQQVAMQGDTPASRALFLARIKQELNIFADVFDAHPGADERLVAKVKKFNDAVNSVVPFDVDEVLKASTRQQTAPRAGGSRPTEEEFLKAAKPVNPGMSDDEIRAEYRRRYGR